MPSPQEFSQAGQEATQAFEGRARWLGPAAPLAGWFFVPASITVARQLSSETNTSISLRAWARAGMAAALFAINLFIPETIPLKDPVLEALLVYGTLSVLDGIVTDNRRHGFSQTSS